MGELVLRTGRPQWLRLLIAGAKLIGPTTALLAAALVGVFVVEEVQTPLPDFIAAGHAVAFPPPLLLDFGLIPDDVKAGQWWLLVTYGFVHADVFNLASNVLGLLIVGAMFERAIGHLRFLGIFLLSVVGGGLFIVVTATHFVLASGASGGILGLTATGVIAGLRYQTVAVRGAYGIGLIVVWFVNGLSIPQVSYADHVGGLVIGAIAGLALGVSSRTKRQETEAIVMSQRAEAASFAAKGDPGPDGVRDPQNRLTLLRASDRSIAMSQRLEAASFAAKGDPGPDGVRDPHHRFTLPRTSDRSLVLTPRGFELVSGKSAHEIRWRDVIAFTADRRNLVEYRYTPAYIARQRSPIRRMACSFPRSLRVTTMPPVQLATLLESWRTRWS
jgi:membrane associated rhomboid family serine protease